jgi:hypothetical protein
MCQLHLIELIHNVNKLRHVGAELSQAQVKLRSVNQDLMFIEHHFWTPMESEWSSVLEKFVSQIRTLSVIALSQIWASYQRHQRDIFASFEQRNCHSTCQNYITCFIANQINQMIYQYSFSLLYQLFHNHDLHEGLICIYHA